MGGTHSGGLQTKDTVYELYGKDYYSKIGRRGGLAKSPNKGFGSMDAKKHLEASQRGGHNGKPYSRTKKQSLIKSLIRRLFNGR